VFQGIDITTLLSGCTFDGSKWIGCNEVDGSNASLLDCKILAPTVVANSHGLLWNTATDTLGKLDGMQFSKGTNAHHAIDFGTLVADGEDITLTNIEFTNFGASADSNDSTLRFLATTGTLTVNLSGCTVNGATATASNVTVDNRAGLIATVVASTTVTFTGMKDNSEVRVYKTSDNSVVAGIEDATDGTSGNRTFAWSAPAGLSVYYVIHNFEDGVPMYQTIRKNGYLVPATNTEVGIQQVIDRNVI